MRDTYRDHLTAQEACELGRDGTWLRQKAIVAGLWKRSGGKQVGNARMTAWEDPRAMAQQFCVSFDSRAWTGR